ncbi:MAG: hypothetical protein ACLFVQ_08350 [Chitinispirillaceae bacterium]
MKAEKILLVLLFSVQLRAAQAPEWVRGFGSGGRFSSSRYITGYGIANVENKDGVGESMQLARESAVSMLVSSIRSTFTVRNRVESVFSRRSGEKERVLEELSSSVLSEGRLQLENMGTELYHDESGRKVHALVWIDRGNHARVLRSRMASAASAIRLFRETFEDSMAEGKYDQVRMLYPLVNEKFSTFVEDGYTLELFGGVLAEDYGPLITYMEQLPVLVRRRPARSCDAMSSLVVSDLLSQFSPEEQSTIAITAPRTIRGEVSRFSLVLGEKLERELVRRGKMSAVQAGSDESRAFSTGGAVEFATKSGAQYLLTTSYSQAGEEIQVSLKVHDLAGGRVVATSFDYMHSDVIARMDDGTVPGLGPHFEIWAGSGLEEIEKGHSYRFYVRTAGPLYLRVLVRLDNGMVLVPDPMFKNFFLDAHKTPYALPGLFVIDSSLPCTSLEFQVSARPFGQLDLKAVVIGGRVYAAVAEGRIGSEGEVMRRRIRVVEGRQSG